VVDRLLLDLKLTVTALCESYQYTLNRDRDQKQNAYDSTRAYGLCAARTALSTPEGLMFCI